MPQLTGYIPVSNASTSAPAVMEALRNKIQQLEKKEAATQRQVEVMQRRFDRQEADRKIELHKQEAQARCDKLEAKAEMDKRDARSDKLEMKAEMMKDMLLQQQQQQIAQLKWEARPGQAPTPQVVYSSPPPPPRPPLNQGVYIP